MRYEIGFFSNLKFWWTGEIIGKGMREDIEKKIILRPYECDGDYCESCEYYLYCKCGDLG